MPTLFQWVQYQGVFFTECEDGFNGLECSTECTGHCKDGPCNHITGDCDKGCSDGWTGDHCDTGF